MIIGTVEVITFRTTRSDHPYWFSLHGLITGISVGHVALRIRITDTSTLQEFLPQFTNIPNRTTNHGHELYFSFWPSAEHSKLEDHRHDCEQSANYSPFTYDARFINYLNPPVKIVKSYLPLLDKITLNIINTPPAIILHTSRLQNAYGNKLALVAQIYAKLYSLWRRILIHEQNAEIIFANDATKVQPFKRLTQVVKVRTQLFEKLLKMHIHDLDNFISYGFTERDMVSLPLTRQHFLPMLEFMRHVTDYPHLYKYNVLSTNCADVSLRALVHGFKDHLSGLLTLRNGGITLTPTYLLQAAANVQLTPI